MVDEALVDETRSYRTTYLWMLISSFLSLSASLVLSVDAITLAKNSNSKLFCDINSVVSCGKVALSWQSNLLGFPNSFIGLICEPVVITLAVAGLGRTKFPKWFLKTALAIYAIGLIFALWLLSQSFFVIKAFCPWCLVVTISTVTVFSTMLRVNLYENTFRVSPQRYEKISSFLDKGRDYVVVTAIYSIIFLAILFKYGKYFLPR
ncbi:MAG: vitamin K epoxide reductase family protein [Actinobacteria bacterium]|nr:vitamin K epoxide reductase family protein [Actinomycetota bacterium]